MPMNHIFILKPVKIESLIWVRISYSHEKEIEIPELTRMTSKGQVFLLICEEGHDSSEKIDLRALKLIEEAWKGIESGKFRRATRELKNSRMNSRKLRIPPLNQGLKSKSRKLLETLKLASHKVQTERGEAVYVKSHRLIYSLVEEKLYFLKEVFVESYFKN